jgi:hypothetical protein
MGVDAAPNGAMSKMKRSIYKQAAPTELKTGTNFSGEQPAVS